MSGGHFNYACHAISQFAADLQHELDMNDSDEADQFGHFIGRHYQPETVAVLQCCQQMLELYGRLAREIEWLYSGDHSEESFLRIMRQIAKERLAATTPQPPVGSWDSDCCGGGECP